MSNLEISDWNKIVINNVNTQHKFKLIIIDKKNTEQEFTFTNLETINVNNIKEVISAKVGYGKAWKNVISIVNKLLQSNTVNADNTDEPSNTVDKVVPSNMTYIKNSKLFKLEFIKHQNKYKKYPNYYFS